MIRHTLTVLFQILTLHECVCDASGSGGGPVIFIRTGVNEVYDIIPQVPLSVEIIDLSHGFLTSVYFSLFNDVSYPSLRTLRLNRNSIASMACVSGTNSAITRLELHDNNLVDNIDFTCLPSLTQLDMSMNRLGEETGSGDFIMDLTGCPALTFLDLSDNTHILADYVLFEDMITPVYDLLTELRLSGALIDVVEGENPRNLLYLDLSRNLINTTDFLNSYFCGVVDLNLANNNIKIVNISCQHQLFSLNLSYNNLVDIITLPQSLFSLDITANNFIDFPQITSNIQLLYVSYNDLQEFNAGTFSQLLYLYINNSYNLETITELNLNNLIELHADFNSGLIEASAINCASNCVSSLAVLNLEFSDVTNLGFGGYTFPDISVVKGAFSEVGDDLFNIAIQATNMTYLDLSLSDLTNFYVAPSFVSLTYLDISYNMLSVSGSDFIHLGDSLTTLKLADLGLSSMVDLSVPTRQNLQVLDLFANDLTQISCQFMEDLNSIRELYLHYNSIDDFCDSWESNNLTFLWLQNNFITNFPRVTSAALEYLDLSDNDIVELVPAQSIYNFTLHLPALEHLDLRDNFITYSANSFDTLEFHENLVFIDLSYNEIGEFPEQFVSITTLQYINLDHNSIPTLPNAILQLPNLKHFAISHNEVSDFPEITCTQALFYPLEELYMDGNGMQLLDANDFYKLSCFCHLTNLVMFQNALTFDLELNVLAVHIVSYCGGQFDNVPRLEMLDLSENSLTLDESCEIHIDSFPSLETVLLSNNSFGDSCTNVHILLNPVVTELHVADNNISEITFSVPSGNNLTDLIVSGNRLASLPLSDFSSLQVLDAAENLLSTLAVTYCPTSDSSPLREAHLEHNHLDAIPDFTCFDKLETFHVSHNNLADLSEIDITRLLSMNLSEWDLTGCNIQDIYDIGTCPFTNNITETVILNENDFSQLDSSSNGFHFLECLTNLATVTLTDSMVNSLTMFSLAQSSSLEYMDLSSNDIAELNFTHLSGFPNLSTLDIRDSNVSQISGYSRSLEVIELTGSRLMCDCGLYESMLNMSQAQFLFDDYPCSQPAYMINVPETELLNSLETQCGLTTATSDGTTQPSHSTESGVDLCIIPFETYSSSDLRTSLYQYENDLCRVSTRNNAGTFFCDGNNYNSIPRNMLLDEVGNALFNECFGPAVISTTDEPGTTTIEELSSEAHETTSESEVTTTPSVTSHDPDTTTVDVTSVQDLSTEDPTPSVVPDHETSTEPMNTIVSDITTTEARTTIVSEITATEPMTTIVSEIPTTEPMTTIVSEIPTTEPMTTIVSEIPTTEPMTTIVSEIPTTEPVTTVISEIPTTDPMTTIVTEIPTTDPMTAIVSEIPTTEPIHTLASNTATAGNSMQDDPGINNMPSEFTFPPIASSHTISVTTDRTLQENDNSETSTFQSTQGTEAPANMSRTDVTEITTSNQPSSAQQIVTQTGEVITCHGLHSWLNYDISYLSNSQLVADTVLEYSCIEGYEFTDNYAQRVARCQASGEWKPSLRECMAVPAQLLDETFLKPVEAKGAAFIGTFAIAFLLLEFSFILFLDSTSLKRDFSKWKDNISGLAIIFKSNFSN